MACSLPHNVDEIKAMVQKQIEEDKVRQLAIMNLTVEFENASTTKDDLRQALFYMAMRKHACVDLTGVSPLVGLRDNGFVAGQAALKAESSKVAKHEKTCLENQHVFIPFAFDTFCFLAPEADEFLTRVVQIMRVMMITFCLLCVAHRDPYLGLAVTPRVTAAMAGDCFTFLNVPPPIGDNFHDQLPPDGNLKYGYTAASNTINGFGLGIQMGSKCTVKYSDDAFSTLAAVAPPSNVVGLGGPVSQSNAKFVGSTIDRIAICIAYAAEQRDWKVNFAFNIECDNSADVDNHVACKYNYSFGVGFNGMENDPTQGAVNIIHMANGDGESSYSKNSRLQETVIRKALPALKHTISGISKHDDAIFDKCFNIADLGCSSGTNTLLRASNIIDMVHKACKENNRTTPQFQMSLITTPTFFRKGDVDEADVVISVGIHIFVS
ncbi:putative exostosin-like protein [Tanacetum coccineum]